LKKLPLHKYRFSVITYETDVYDTNVPGGIDGSQERMRNARDIFKSHGYELISGNIANVDLEHPFEDWYVDPAVINEDVIKRFKRDSDDISPAHCYMLFQ